MVSKITTLPPAGQGRGAGEGGSRDRRGQPAGRPLSEALPDVPTISEFVPGYEASGWFGIGAPKNTPTEIVDKLNNEINAGLAGSQYQGAARRPRGHGACAFARRLRQAHR